MAVALGAGFPAVAWAKTADAPGKPGCTIWPYAALRAPCGVSFRGRAWIGSDKDGVEVEIVRAGEWQRQRRAGPPEHLAYENYASGAVIHVGYDPVGQPTFLIEVTFRDPKIEPKRTAETITHLGENCRVWITPEGQTGLDMEHQDCLTEDGVPLLHDFAPRRTGALAQKLAAKTPIWARVSTFQRAAVAQAEVRPPASLFRWSSWGVVATPAQPGEANYEVRLEDSGDRPSGVRAASTIEIRRLGPSELTVKRQRGKVRQMRYRSPERIAEFSSDAEGRTPKLEIWSATGMRATNMARRAAKSTPEAPLDRTETILDEECRWYDLYPTIQDGYFEECRTADGIPLARREMSWGMYSLIARATFLRRGTVRPKDVLPPEQLIRASLWTRRAKP